MASEIRRRGLWPAAAAVIAVATIAVSLLAGAPRGGPNETGGSAANAATTAPATGPFVYYEILDADASVLIERRLDGRSLSRRVAARPDADFGRTWSVSPTGEIAVSGVTAGATTRLEAVSIADGVNRWSIDIPAIDLYPAVWSDDGRRFAAIAQPILAGATEALILDTRDGRVIRAVVPEDAILQGFDGEDALVLRERLEPAGAPRPTWRFLRIDPASNVVQQATGIPAVGPATDGVEDVDPAHGIAVTVIEAQQDPGTALQAWSLGTADGRALATLRSVDRLAIDPAGIGVAVAVNQSIRYLTWDGRGMDLWSGDDAPDDLRWSADGAYLGIASGGPDGKLTIVERATDRTVELPRASRVAAASIVRIVPGGPLPAQPLPPDEPRPTAIPAPAGNDVTGAPSIASAWIERADGESRLHLERLVPTTDGGLRVSASIAPLALSAALADPADEPTVRLFPRPGTGQVLVWVATPDAGRGWLWDGSAPPTPLVLPADWPEAASIAGWSPDGRALAASAERLVGEQDSQSIFAVAEIGGTKTRVIPVVGDYGMLEGWWSRTELRVGHNVCTEGCTGRFAYVARLRIADGKVTPVRPADRTQAAIDEVSPDGTGGLVMRALNEDPGEDIRIDWPTSGPPPELVWLGAAADPRSMIVAAMGTRGSDLYRIDDPAGRAVNGRLTDPRPVLLGHVAHHTNEIRVLPDGRWAIATDRVGETALVELATGHSWPVEFGRSLEWWIGSG